MLCRKELRGLGAVHEALRQRGGSLYAISVDTPEENQAVIREDGLPFPILSDPDAATARRYGLAHEQGGIEKESIAVPAHVLVTTGGRIAWRHRAERIQDRPNPSDVLEEVQKLVRVR